METLIFTTLSCRTDIEKYLDKYIERLECLEHSRLTNAKISEAEAIRNNLSSLFLGRMVVIIAVNGDNVFGAIMATKQSPNTLNIDHLSASNGAGAILMRAIIDYAEDYSFKTLTLTAAGNGNNMEEKQASQNILKDYYAMFGFVPVGNNTSSGQMILML